MYQPLILSLHLAAKVEKMFERKNQPGSKIFTFIRHLAYNPTGPESSTLLI
jgi:hypothetical protein